MAPVHEEPGRVPSEGSPPERARSRFLPWLLVAFAVGFNLWILRAEALPARYLNDASVHFSMVRWAEQRIREGHLPFDGWYPYLSLGASRFHHYQSLPHIITAYISILLGTDRVFAFSLYLLLATWPIAVYWGMRLFGFEPWPSALAALVSPLLVSKPGLGYEDGSYTWRGYGTWTQLWGMWMLPLSWGTTYRAVTRRGPMWVGALALGVTIAVHLLTGYLALLSVGVWVVVSLARQGPWRRLGRAALVVVGGLAVASFMLVPLLLDERVMPQSEISRGTIYYDSFGARQILTWFVTGQLFDRDRVWLITALVMLGLLVALVRFRRDERVRAVVGVGLLSMLLFFGRPTLGSALSLLPGSSDLFLRRFISGVHLAGIDLAGIALAAIGGWIYRRISDPARRWHVGHVPALAGLMLAVLLLLGPVYGERWAWNAQGRTWIHEQLAADATDGANFAALVREGESLGPGRFFSGLRGHGGEAYRIGQVPTFTYLLDLDADAVGFTRPAWSLSSAVEVRFDRLNPAQESLFGVRYLILPTGVDPPVPSAERVDSRGRHVLYEIPANGYLGVVDTVAPPIVADRTDLGTRTASFLTSDDLRAERYPTVAFAGAPAAPPTVSAGGSPPSEPAGSVLRERDDPVDGVFTATVVARRPAMVLLRSSWDNRWQVTVDGHAVEPQMVAPSFVGRTISAGEHSIAFRYAAFPWYWVLFLLAGVAVASLWTFDRRAARLAEPEEIAVSPEEVSQRESEVHSVP